MTPASDLAVVRRAGRIAAIQASVALALVLLVVGGVVFMVYVRAQNRQIDAELRTLAMSADDAGDPPPTWNSRCARTTVRCRPVMAGSPGWRCWPDRRASATCAPTGVITGRSLWIGLRAGGGDDGSGALPRGP